jgi:hypothetical protein
MKQFSSKGKYRWSINLAHDVRFVVHMDARLALVSKRTTEIVGASHVQVHLWWVTGPISSQRKIQRTRQLHFPRLPSFVSSRLQH